ncbi:Fanconi anemia group J protein homolog isoform X2 [Rhipicephalus microplus]|uniref:Fanconi anemia group J protein homolog isoform X2 n=1 Tax=Rhipicephalus microplus TaxID=6941 RepID=UPI003F6A5E05
MDVKAESSAKKEPLYIESHAVYFPHTPYQSQKMVIIKVLQGLRNGRNCLIESPTGSGKTLALLCSCLAWQKKKKEIHQAQVEKMMQAMQARHHEFEDTGSYDPRCSAVPLGGASCKGSRVHGCAKPVTPLKEQQPQPTKPWSYKLEGPPPANGPSCPLVALEGASCIGSKVDDGGSHTTPSKVPQSPLVKPWQYNLEGPPPKDAACSLVALDGAACIGSKVYDERGLCDTPLKEEQAAEAAELLSYYVATPSPSGVTRACKLSLKANSPCRVVTSGAVQSPRQQVVSAQPVVASPAVASASQASTVASPTVPAALATHLPVAPGDLLPANVKPGTEYMVVRNTTGQMLDLNTLLSLPELKTNKDTIVAQASQVTPAKQQAVGKPVKVQPVKTPLKSSIPSPMDDDDDDFKPMKKMRQSVNTHIRNSLASLPSPKREDASAVSSAPSTSTVLEQLIQSQQQLPPSEQPTPSKGCQGIADKPLERVPTIFYGTRTHKQIAQVVRELKKTDYCHVKMCILSSRERTCVHPVVSKSTAKNERCKELLEDMTRGQGGCGYYINMKRAPPAPSMEPYDLEDLVKIGKRIRVCPYYWSLDLMPGADIIFCPYNYLIDPVIRKCLSIDLNNAVVVLDEAHNIEDISREVMSISVTQDQLRDIIADLEEMQRIPYMPEEHYAIASVMSKLSLWITQHSDHLDDYRGFEQSGKVWAGTEILAFMTDVGLSPECFKNFKTLVSAITTVEKPSPEMDPEQVLPPTVNAATSATLQNFVIIFDFMYRDDLKYLGDFRAAMVKAPSKKKQTEASRWLSGGGVGGFNAAWTHSLNFWCLNPAVAMSDIKDKVHSLIVASGTLTPMESFESELDMPFKSQLQANHVIPREGVWIGSITCGPNNVNLTANFKTAETFEFQDEIGSILWDICKNTGMWGKLERLKHIAMEPQKADSDSFDCTMNEYFNHALGKYSDGYEDDRGGALLLAVCRGKVSEGLDFADNSARAVVTIGIPFPNVKDIQVDLKRKYNDQQLKSGRQVMAGNSWYETQAFRALNQALGRCIRHREDWGALIIIDHRFSQQPKFQNALSKWIREQFQCFRYYNEAMDSLKTFMEGKMKKFSPPRCKSEPRGIGPSNDCSMLPAGDTSSMSVDQTEPIELSNDSCEEMFASSPS